MTRNTNVDDNGEITGEGQVRTVIIIITRVEVIILMIIMIIKR